MVTLTVTSTTKIVYRDEGLSRDPTTGTYGIEQALHLKLFVGRPWTSDSHTLSLQGRIGGAVTQALATLGDWNAPEGRVRGACG
ncbi:hypothetical protein GCM10023168_19340 [Fodinibacter luteus]|uniref:Uncharacterized protein n=1 Tax=Fodinibacter luteus TaxID=552064 RepID=A0ABP8KGA5_9MICO